MGAVMLPGFSTDQVTAASTAPPPHLPSCVVHVVLEQIQLYELSPAAACLSTAPPCCHFSAILPPSHTPCCVGAAQPAVCAVTPHCTTAPHSLFTPLTPPPPSPPCLYSRCRVGAAQSSCTSYHLPPANSPTCITPLTHCQNCLPTTPPPNSPCRVGAAQSAVRVIGGSYGPGPTTHCPLPWEG